MLSEMISSSGEQAPAETEAGLLRFPWVRQSECPEEASACDVSDEAVGKGACERGDDDLLHELSPDRDGLRLA